MRHEYRPTEFHVMQGHYMFLTFSLKLEVLNNFRSFSLSFFLSTYCTNCEHAYNRPNCAALCFLAKPFNNTWFLNTTKSKMV